MRSCAALAYSKGTAVLSQTRTLPRQMRNDRVFDSYPHLRNDASYRSMLDDCSLRLLVIVLLAAVERGRR